MLSRYLAVKNGNIVELSVLWDLCSHTIVNYIIMCHIIIESVLEYIKIFLKKEYIKIYYTVL